MKIKKVQETKKFPLELSNAQLLDLFKHWDSGHLSKEGLLVTLSLAVFPAVISTWKDIDPIALTVAAVASVITYSYHLFTTDRYAEFQDRIFKIFRTRGLTTIEAIVNAHDEYRTLSIRAMRVIMLPVIALLWGILIHSRISCSPLVALPLIIALPIAIYTWPRRH